MITLTRADGFTRDNDFLYLDNIRAGVASADGSASFSFSRKDHEIIVHIKPSKDEFKQNIIDNLLAANKLLGFKIIFSKSLAISKTVSFTVSL